MICSIVSLPNEKSEYACEWAKYYTGDNFIDERQT